MKRQRGRGRNKNNNHGNRQLDSSGPDVKVRGSATQIHDKYVTLARDAASSGNRVKAENYLQHAEHYLRLMNVQEAAKQAAREEAEAARLARSVMRLAKTAALKLIMVTAKTEKGVDIRRGHVGTIKTKKLAIRKVMKMKA